MGNSDKSGKNRDSSSAGSPQEMQLQLWEINEVIIARDYTATQTGAGLYYTLRTSRQDLPAGFLHIDWVDATTTREQAEKRAESSGRIAQEARGLAGGQLLSQMIANHPNMPLLRSSAKSAKQARSNNKG